jgi:hypothetical protein
VPLDAIKRPMGDKMGDSFNLIMYIKRPIPFTPSGIISHPEK